MARNRTSLIAFILLLDLILTIAPAGAGRDLSLEGLEVLRRGFAGMQDFSADIVQEKQIALMKQTMTARGVVRFKKPGIFFMELNPPYASRLLIKGNVLEVNLPAEGVKNRIVLPPDETLERWFTYLAQPVSKLPDGAEVRAERRGTQWTLLVSPKGKGGVRELQLVFEGNGNLKRLTIEEKNRDRTVIRFNNIRRNTGLNDKDFLVD